MNGRPLLLLLISTWASLARAVPIDHKIIETLAKNEPTVLVGFALSGFKLDPVEANLTRNTWLMPLLYSPPTGLVINVDDPAVNLTTLSYDRSKFEMTLSLNPGNTYSDGSSVTIEDIELAIKRYALKNQGVPPIDRIVGLDRWVGIKHPLLSYPQGIKTSDDRITIRFAKDASDYLTFASDRMLSVIPSRCIDLAQNKLLCEQPPFSGEYTLDQGSTLPILTFKKRSQNRTIPDIIHLIQIDPSDIAFLTQHIHNKTVVLVDEITIPYKDFDNIKKYFRPNMTPKIRFYALNFNTDFPPFDNKRARQLFANLARATINELKYEAQGSIFAKISPGFISLSDLEKGTPIFSKDETKKITKLIERNGIKWQRKNNSFDYRSFILEKTIERMGLGITETFKITDHKKFAKDHENISFFIAGFDLDDPSVDLRVSLNNPSLSKISNDPIIKELLGKIQHDTHENLQLNSLESINRYLFDESILAVVDHFTIFQYTRKESPLQIKAQWTPKISHYFYKDEEVSSGLKSLIKRLKTSFFQS